MRFLGEERMEFAYTTFRTSLIKLNPTAIFLKKEEGKETKRSSGHLVADFVDC